MADFIGGNLFASVQKKIFPKGVAVDVMERLDNMEVFTGARGKKATKVDGLYSTNSVASQALSMYKAYDFNNISELTAACQENGMRVKVDSVETKYVADEAQTGSVSQYTFTDRMGNKVTINNVNAQEYIDQERASFDGILSGVIDEVIAGKINLPDDPYAQQAA